MNNSQIFAVLTLLNGLYVVTAAVSGSPVALIINVLITTLCACAMIFFAKKGD